MYVERWFPYTLKIRIELFWFDKWEISRTNYLRSQHLILYCKKVELRRCKHTQGDLHLREHRFALALFIEKVLRQWISHSIRQISTQISHTNHHSPLKGIQTLWRNDLGERKVKMSLKHELEGKEVLKEWWGAGWVSLLWLPSQITTDRVAKTIELYFPTVLDDRKSKMKMPTELVSSKRSLSLGSRWSPSWFTLTWPFLCVCMERKREREHTL